MKGRKKDPIQETTRTLAVLFVCLLLLSLMLPISVANLIAPEEWTQREIEFASIEYTEPEELSDHLPGVLGQIVEFLSWDDEANDGEYVITDADGGKWNINSTVLEYGMDTALLYETVREGDILTIRHIEEEIYAMSCGDVDFLSYEQAWARDRENAVGVAAFFAVCLVLAVWMGYWLFRLRREGEHFWRKLPKWLRESW